MTFVDIEPAPNAGGHLLLRAALVCGLGFAAPWLVGCGGGSPKTSDATASEASSSARLTAPLLGEAAVAVLPAAIQVKAEDPSSFSVDSFVAALLVDALVEGRSGLTIAPRLDAEGATQGYRLEAIPEDSPFARLGLRPGDIVGAINGIGMTSPERARSAIASGRRHLVVAVERGDTALFLDYRLVDGLAWSVRVREEGGVEAVAEDPVAVVDATALVAAVDDDALEALAADAKAGGHPGAGGGGSAADPGTGKALGGGGKPTAGGGGKPSSPGKSSPGKSSPGKSGSGSSSGGGSSTSASCASADSCTIRRSELDAVLANPSKASKQVRYKPHISGGKHRGYRLTSVTPGSAVAGLGMRKGDVITKVNGHSLTDDGELFALYMGLGGTSTFRINYERGGAKRVKTVRAR